MNAPLSRPEDLVEGSLTGAILRCALEVHKALGPGLLESAYRSCLVKELDDAGLRCASEVEVATTYKGVRIPGVYRADLLVEDRVIVELKTVEKLLPLHSSQLLTYLRLSGVRVGLLLNFNVALLKHGTRRLVI